MHRFSRANNKGACDCKKKESPLKARDQLIAIDAGFSKAYQKKTGIAGYTLVY
ncbi:MAG: fructose-bisphosphatase class III, partial [Desulfobacterales bacterium]|nr:fructose-bisphosphatase class III [Desulfobacterales bacterium]